MLVFLSPMSSECSVNVAMVMRITHFLLRRNMPLTGREGQNDLMVSANNWQPLQFPEAWFWVPRIAVLSRGCWKGWSLCTRYSLIKSRFSNPHSLGWELILLTLRTEQECFKNICHSCSTKILFSHSADGFPVPRQSVVVYVPWPCYFNSQHSPSQSYPDGHAQGQKRLNPVYAVGKETGQSLDWGPSMREGRQEVSFMPPYTQVPKTVPDTIGMQEGRCILWFRLCNRPPSLASWHHHTGRAMTVPATLHTLFLTLTTTPWGRVVKSSLQTTN